MIGTVKIIDWSTTVSTGIQYCDECLCKIPEGVKIRRGIYRWFNNEKLDIHRRCPDCDSIARFIIIHQKGELISDLSRAIVDKRVSVNSEGYEDLTPKARKKVDNLISLQRGDGI